MVDRLSGSGAKGAVYPAPIIFTVDCIDPAEPVQLIPLLLDFHANRLRSVPAIVKADPVTNNPTDLLNPFNR